MDPTPVSGGGRVTVTADRNEGAERSGTVTIGGRTVSVIHEEEDVNTPPVAVDDTATTTQNTPVSVPVLANDTDGDGDSLRIDGIVTAPSQGTAVVNRDGQTITYTPSLDSTGAVTFHYRIADGRGGMADAAVTVTVVSQESFGPECLNPSFTPEARAGTDQTVSPGTLVTLDGSRSFDHQLCPLAYRWARVSGPNATLNVPTAAKPTFTVPEDAQDGTEWVFELTVTHESNSPHSDTDRVRVTVAADALPLNAKRDVLVEGWAARIGKAGDGEVCEAWHSLHHSARNVFIWNTHRLHRSRLLREVTALHAVFGTDRHGFCGGEEHNRTFMSMNDSLQDKFLAEALKSSSDPLPAWRHTQDPKGAHPPYMFSVETHDGDPRGQIHFFHRDWVRVTRSFNDECDRVTLDIHKNDVCERDTCPGERNVPVPPWPDPDWRIACHGDQYSDRVTINPADPEAPPLKRRGPNHEVMLGGSVEGAAIFEMDQDYNQPLLEFQYHDSAPVCRKYSGVPPQLVDVDKRDAYAHKYGDPEWHWEPSHCRVAREANRPFSFNDESLRTTGVRAVTARELRARINGLRHGLDLAPFVWTNPTIDSGRTFIRVVHVMELRRALTQAYVAAAREPPTYTDDPIVAEVTPVSAEHFIELRAAVTALEQ